jgi:hypothetical protein
MPFLRCLAKCMFEYIGEVLGFDVLFSRVRLKFSQIIRHALQYFKNSRFLPTSGDAAENACRRSADQWYQVGDGRGPQS